jgi:integrase
MADKKKPPLRSRAGLRVPLTAVLVDGLKFENYPVGVDDRGRLLTMETPASMMDWSLRDSDVRGFGVRLTRNGAKSFFVQTRPHVRGKGDNTRGSKRLVLKERHLRDARKVAVQWIAALQKGDDPNAETVERLDASASEKARNALTFSVLMAEYSMGTGIEPSTRGLTKLSNEERRKHRELERQELLASAKSLLIKTATLRDRRYAAAWMRKEKDLSACPLHLLTTTVVNKTFAPMFAAAKAAREAAEMPAKPSKKKVKRTRGNGPYQDVATAHKILRHCNAAWNLSNLPAGRESPFAKWRTMNKKKLPAVGRRLGTLPLNKESGAKWLREVVALHAGKDFAMGQLASYVLCLLLWGGRKTEVQRLRWGDILLDDHVVKFRAANTKSRRDQYLPLAPWAQSLLNEHKARLKRANHSVHPDSWVWPSTNTADTPIVEIRPILEHLNAVSGIYINAHDLRRTVATDVYGDTKDLSTVGFALGHADSITSSYIQERVAILRPIYEAREARIRTIAGLDKSSSGRQRLSESQLASLRNAHMILREAKIDPALLAAYKGRS